MYLVNFDLLRNKETKWEWISLVFILFDIAEVKIESLEKELSHANDLLAAKKSGSFSATDEDVEKLFPQAMATSRLLKSGMTLTQIYSNYMTAVEDLDSQKEENKRLNSYLEQILQEIEDRAPKMKKQREDYEAALDTLNQITPQLDAAMLVSQIQDMTRVISNRGTWGDVTETRKTVIFIGSLIMNWI